MADTLHLVVEDEEAGARLTPQLLQRLREELAAASTARVVVIEGRPGAFCEGLDVRSIGADIASGMGSPVESTLDLFRQLLHELRATPRPVVAVIDGPAMGGGVGLAAVADLVLASTRATFSLPETLFGLIPAVIFPYLSERLGVARARSMAIAGEVLAADRAAEWGLVDEVCHDLQTTLASLERRLIRQDPRAHAEIKKLINVHFGHPEAYGVAATTAFSSLLESPSTRDRLARFAAGENPWPETPRPGR